MKEKLELNIDENATAPVYEQLANELRRLICARTFAPGEQVPSIRVLAEQIGVSPTTVRRAFQMLIDEGWLTQQRGSGTYVSDSIDVQASYLLQGDQQQLARRTPAMAVSIGRELLQGTWAQYISNRAVTSSMDATTHGAPIDIDMSSHAGPAGADAPMSPAALAHYIDKALDTSTALTEPSGDHELRELIANWISLSRSIRCGASDIIVVSGRRQARSMVARLFGGEGKRIVFEEPSSMEARFLFSSFGWNTVPVAVDESGIVIEELEVIADAAALYLRPSSQFPTGAVLSRMRRERVAQWAQNTGAIVIEDDAGCDFSYESRVTPAVASFLPERSVYIGTFSDVLPASWQIAFLVVRPTLHEAFYRLKLVADRCTSPVVQNVLKLMFTDGQLQRAVTRLQREYGRTRDQLARLLSDMPEGAISFSPVKGGVHQTIWLSSSLDDLSIVDECLDHGVALTAVSPLFATTPARPGILINFSAVDERAVQQAISVLREVITKHYGA